jgi:hypothetical protein
VTYRLHETAHLAVDTWGHVYVHRLHERTLTHPYRLGDVRDEPIWPFPKAPEPDWFEAELTEMVEAWEESVREAVAERALRDDEYNASRGV